MARLKKGIWVFNDASGEYDSPGVDGRTINYREVLLDWLNRALSGTPADRDAAGRIGALINKMNHNTAEYLETVNSWQSEGGLELGVFPVCKTFRAIAASYELELDLCPRHGSKKWHLAFRCVNAPSGEELEPSSGIHESWPNVPKHFNPECEAVDAVVFIALEGRLGTIRRCEVGSCRKWFLSKDDLRVRCCRDHDVDDLRKRTPERKAQVNAAAKRARERERDGDEKYWKRRKSEDHLDRPLAVEHHGRRPVHALRRMLDADQHLDACPSILVGS